MSVVENSPAAVHTVRDAIVSHFSGFDFGSQWLEATSSLWLQSS